MDAKPTGTCEPHVQGRVYEVTEVLSWWLAHHYEEPAWLPTMGELHEDTAFFRLPALHYHVDPRYLSGQMQACAENEQKKAQRYELYPDYQTWHPAYHRVLCDFPADHPTEYFTISAEKTSIWDRREARWSRTMPAAWGLERIRTRKRLLECRRRLPPAANDERSGRGFVELRNAFGNVCGDICPHRGYDLRSVPVVDGYRTCPLHQLRVRAGRR